MKFTHIITLLLTTLTLNPLFSARAEFPASDNLTDIEAAYRQSLDYGDGASAVIFATRLAVAAQGEAVKWKQELARLHFLNSQYPICLRVIDDLQSMQGGKLTLDQLELKGLSHEAIGQKEQAMATWQNAMANQPRAMHATRLAGLYLEAGQLDEAGEVIESGFSTEDIDSGTILLPKTKEQAQEIPIKAALHNLKYQLILKRDNKAIDQARAELEAALELAPDFEIAKRNLEALGEKEDQTPPVDPQEK